MSDEQLPTVQLFYQEGTSDKVYHATIVGDEGDTFTVRVAWGRRGSNLNQGTKALRATREAAQRAYDKVVREKTRKGYQEITDDVVPAVVAPPAGEGSGTRAGVGGRERMDQAAQLLNAVNDEDTEVQRLIADDGVVAQQKFDGMRILAHVYDDRVVTTNRGGELTGLDRRLAAPLSALGAGSIIDGEMVAGRAGDAPTYWVFDLLASGGEDLREDEYLVRYSWLKLRIGASADEDKETIRVVPMAQTADEKRTLVARLRGIDAEGVVFKRADACYRPGRPASGGDQLKVKFVKTADVVIVENAGNAYRMVVVQDDGKFHDVGKVFSGTTNAIREELDRALSAGERPVAEVRYLYATDADHLFQPVRHRRRPPLPACVREAAR
ncbi:MAG: WGR domain-containing protein [Deltaproteobacteria bacterium]|nr:WGR domain-containing protein [Deltaproteobacteria bacterium]